MIPAPRPTRRISHAPTAPTKESGMKRLSELSPAWHKDDDGNIVGLCFDQPNLKTNAKTGPARCAVMFDEDAEAPEGVKVAVRSGHTCKLLRRVEGQPEAEPIEVEATEKDAFDCVCIPEQIVVRGVWSGYISFGAIV